MDNRGDIEELLLVRRIDALVSASPFVLVAAVFSIAFLFVTFGNDVPPPLLAGWALSALVMLAVRVTVMRRITLPGADRLRSGAVSVFSRRLSGPAA